MSDETPEDTLVPVILHRVSTYHMPIKTEPGTDTTAAAMDRTSLVLLPGLNWCSGSKLREASPSKRANVKVTVQDPTALEPDEAIELVRQTTSRDARRRWRALEERPEVIAEIDASLHGASEQVRSAVIASV